MNKNLLTYTLILVGMATATLVSAATFSISPANISVTEGQTFSVSVFVDPQGVANYTEKLELKYSPSALEVRSFSFGGSWMPISQPGYDSIDNANGLLIKTGGYPGGFTSKILLGTVTFRAKATGNETIQVTANSMALDSGSKNVVSGLPISASVSIASAPVVAPKTPKPVVASAPAPKQDAKQVAVTPDQFATQPVAVVENKSLFSATIVNLNITFGGLLILLGVFLIGFFAYKRFKSETN